ncbi:MAG: metalloendopeptidase glycoprotease family, O-sialoglycoprotein endopeptidase [candidate division Kazan bacterium GW2011_GWA1_50_15]|uniref:tRNA N6-adenosine threonylcarbamoyltransferase n=2 Tax=Bacteria division Kazan-3B-28 TaxID=1798534 RepID=A0A0G1X7R7_UNCK3|nr:MAG: metalloendopeptidase glycoprotease family, O-sialoglycoprotein endopeptidase [candidate division Kazan bacterium GW2011_GWA1_50_15]KKW25762.1 MAG: putative tRNA threonylcarbamoyladenosine biosynthesis protein Gcp [candidate division Kazan bacterium GW2011_GWC1_52_13]KKW27223.1 MAG: putative tRNA threonylcarbamoyladenosine biosynthesis protein Gcp [candidate division Kazan bacterium GW2011_GWB1_52_7]HAV65949.1 tRNA (adenosine(37)-N6)-threonylcarbamoyltransferase complex transferase subuni
MTKILAIETSCDDTSVAIVENGHKVLVNLVASQEKLHATFGGVVPEVASREHLKAIYPLIELALKRAKLTPKQIDAIAVTVGPGLLGSLLVGVNAAKTLGYLWGKRVLPVNHLMGHIYAGFIDHPKLELPLLALVVSGGHSELVLVGRHGEYKYLGGTRDDAAGEAFDKVARLLQLGYPGGPAVAAEAAKAKLQITNYKKGKGIKLPRPMLDEGDLDFSFSGLKTAVSRVKGRPADIAHEFQDAVVDVLTDKLARAASRHQAKTIVLGGGVAANQALRGRVSELAKARGWQLVIPDFKYCTDNAAMIGSAGHFLTMGGGRADRLAEQSEARLRRRASRGKLGVLSRRSKKYKWYNTNVMTS